MKWSPGCRCCGAKLCTDCTNPFTTITLSGADTGGCIYCGDIDGTYVMRGAGDPIPGNCYWSAALPFNNLCNGFGHPYLGLACLCVLSGPHNLLAVSIGTSGSNYVATVTLRYTYCDYSTFTGTYTGNNRLSIYKRTSATCAGLLGVATFDSYIDTTGDGDPRCTTLGDYCGLDGLTVTIG